RPGGTDSRPLRPPTRFQARAAALDAIFAIPPPRPMPYRSRPIFSLLLSVLASAALALASPARAQSVQSPIPAGSSPRAIAVNPITNKIYIASELSNSVVVVDGATNGTSTIPVGTRPQYIAVNPATDKVYVTSGSDSTLTVIDGATDTVSATLPLGSNGPIAI